MNNNAKKFDYQKYEYGTVFSPYTYFYSTPLVGENSLRATFNNIDILALKISEKEHHKMDLIISFPEDFSCTHFFKNKPSITENSSSDMHLTYHGFGKKKKQSGEIHLTKSGGKRSLGNKQNLLEAPLAKSSDIGKFPLPICRFELSPNLKGIVVRKRIDNYFELNCNNGYFLNTMDIYLAKAGFMEKALKKAGTQNEILLSLFVNSSLRTFSIGELGWEGEIMSRGAIFAQILVLPAKENEVIIFNVLEKSNKSYTHNALHYFHTKNYFHSIINRNIVQNEKGQTFIDLKTGAPKKWGLLKEQINCDY